MLSIIIVHYDTSGELRECLQSLSDVPDFIEILVVDNDSPSTVDVPRGIVEKHPRMRWLAMDSNLGFGAAVRAGVEASSGDKIFILNPDSIILDADWETFYNAIVDDLIVGAALESAAGHVELQGWFRPGIVTEFARTFAQATIDRGRHWPARIVRRLAYEPGRIAWVTGAACAMTRRRWDQLGGFDAQFFLFFEDIDLCLRHLELGGVCVVRDELRILHHRGVASRRHSQLAERHYRESQRVFWDRHGGWMSRPFMRLVNQVQKRRMRQRRHWSPRT